MTREQRMCCASNADEWKIVQIHWSLSKPNVEFLGRTLTTSLEELERTLRLEQPDLSGSLLLMEP